LFRLLSDPRTKGGSQWVSSRDYMQHLVTAFGPNSCEKLAKVKWSQLLRWIGSMVTRVIDQNDDADGPPGHETSQSTIEVRRTSLSGSRWDAFAQRCDASLWCADGTISIALFLRHFCIFARRYEFYSVGPDLKIGQCAVGFGPSGRVILDGLQILGEHESLWGDALIALLVKIGNGNYIYGSDWSVERSRYEELVSLPGVTVISRSAITMQAIDFSKWASWDAYFADISTNIKRNIKKAKSSHPDAKITIESKKITLSSFFILLRLVGAVANRKQLNFSYTKLMFSLAIRVLFLRPYARLGLITDAGTPFSAFFGICFGDNVYFLKGGSIAGSSGLSWVLLLEMIKTSFEHSHGRGKFLMGMVHDDDEPGWKDLLRSRAQCRVSNYPTSLLKFRYGAAPDING
jgi:hypothetical protein